MEQDVSDGLDLALQALLGLRVFVTLLFEEFHVHPPGGSVMPCGSEWRMWFHPLSARKMTSGIGRSDLILSQVPIGGFGGVAGAFAISRIYTAGGGFFHVSQYVTSCTGRRLPSPHFPVG